MGDAFTRKCRNPECGRTARVGAIGVADVPIDRCPYCDWLYGPFALGLDTSSAATAELEAARQRDTERRFNERIREQPQRRVVIEDDDGDPT